MEQKTQLSGGEGMPHLSRADIEKMADGIILRYKQAFVPEKHLCYKVDPSALAFLYGFEIDYQNLSKDGSILGVTSSGTIMTTVLDDGMKEMFYLLDGRTILVEKRLLCSPKNVGRRNFTIAHELAHQIINRAYPEIYGSQSSSVITAAPLVHAVPPRTGTNGRLTHWQPLSFFLQMPFLTLCLCADWMNG